MTANEWDDEVKRLWGTGTCVDYAPGVPAFETRYRVYHKAVIIGSGNSYAEAVERAKRNHPPMILRPLPSLATGEGDETPLLSGAEVSEADE